MFIGNPDLIGDLRIQYILSIDEKILCFEDTHVLILNFAKVHALGKDLIMSQ
jgi:hypothetical protein